MFEFAPLATSGSARAAQNTLAGNRVHDTLVTNSGGPMWQTGLRVAEP